MEPSAEVVARLERDIREHKETKSKELLELIIQGLSDLCDRVVVLDSVDSMLLNWYGTSLRIRFDDQKDPTDLDKAIELFQEAARHPTSNTASRTKAINNLGHALQCRWEARANPDDLDAAISNLRTAVRETDMLSPTRTEYLEDFVDALWARIDERDSVSDLSEALEYIGLAELQTYVSEEVYVTRLARLSQFLADRFQRTRSSTDLNRAIGLKKELVGLLYGRKSIFAFTDFVSPPPSFCTAQVSSRITYSKNTGISHSQDLAVANFCVAGLGVESFTPVAVRSNSAWVLPRCRDQILQQCCIVDSHKCVFRCAVPSHFTRLIDHSGAFRRMISSKSES